MWVLELNYVTHAASSVTSFKGEFGKVNPTIAKLHRV